MLVTRVITGAILVSVIGAVLAFSYIPWVLSLAVAVLCALSVYELYRATYQLKKEGLVSICMVGTTMLSFSMLPNYHWIAAAILPVALLLSIIIMTKIGKKSSFNTAETILLCALITLMLQAIPQIRNREYGLYELVFVLLICWVTDAAAYFVGKAFGKHKLAPKISPGKTVEGCIGGTVIAVSLMLAVSMILEKWMGISIHFSRLLVYLIIASLAGQFGDLSMSAIKRITQIKDFGTLLPGHGGVLDRFDSLLPVLPLTYLFCSYCGFFM